MHLVQIWNTLVILSLAKLPNLWPRGNDGILKSVCHYFAYTVTATERQLWSTFAIAITLVNGIERANSTRFPHWDIALYSIHTVHVLTCTTAYMDYCYLIIATTCYMYLGTKNMVLTLSYRSLHVALVTSSRHPWSKNWVALGEEDLTAIA